MRGDAQFAARKSPPRLVGADTIFAHKLQWEPQQPFTTSRAAPPPNRLIGACGGDVPPVDLPDLRPFVEAMLVQNRRRPRRGADGSLSFKTPEAWLNEIGVRTSYEGLVFDRTVRGRDAVVRVVGVGHKVVEQALRQALDETACVTSVSRSAFHHPLVIVRLSDRVTGRDSPVRGVVFAAERTDEGDKWSILRDWEVVRRLNETVGNVNVLRTACAPLEERSVVKTAVDNAISVIAEHSLTLDLGFRVPFIQPIAVIWPGTECGPVNLRATSDTLDDLLE